jgi:hypothetical protein
LPTAGSLKEKRRIVKSITTNLRNNFNVSVAEVDHHEAWGAAQIAVACVSTDRAHAHQTLTRAVRAVERDRMDLILVDYTIEFW